jgi:uncharacterized protein with FMN-binding domain
MRRALVALVVTVAAVWWLANYETHLPATERHAVARPPIRAGAVRTAVGPPAITPFSFIQVEATLTNGRLTGVRTVELTGNGEHTQRLNAHAEPILRRRALRAGSAKFDVVSGATYTSESYQESLQAAIDMARRAQ